jgi:hypothetical protein
VNVQPASDFPSIAYLVLAYAFGTVVLGAFLVWSLRRLRDLDRGDS